MLERSSVVSESQLESFFTNPTHLFVWLFSAVVNAVWSTDNFDKHAPDSGKSCGCLHLHVLVGAVFLALDYFIRIDLLWPSIILSTLFL